MEGACPSPFFLLPLPRCPLSACHFPSLQLSSPLPTPAQDSPFVRERWGKVRKGHWVSRGFQGWTGSENWTEGTTAPAVLPWCQGSAEGGQCVTGPWGGV